VVTHRWSVGRRVAALRRSFGSCCPGAAIRVLLSGPCHLSTRSITAIKPCVAPPQLLPDPKAQHAWSRADGPSVGRLSRCAGRSVQLATSIQQRVVPTPSSSGMEPDQAGGRASPGIRVLLSGSCCPYQFCISGNQCLLAQYTIRSRVLLSTAIQKYQRVLLSTASIRQPVSSSA